MRKTVVLVMTDVRARRMLLDGFSERGWRVRMSTPDRDELRQACGDADVGLIVVEWALACGERRCGVDDGQIAESVPGESSVARVRAVCGVPVIAAASAPAAEDVVLAIKDGAIDFLDLDVEVDEIAEAIERVTGLCAVRGVGDEAATPIEARIVGSSPAARLMRSRLHGLATLASPVLVIGEAGTGRDTVARALHEAGAQSSDGFRGIDCARWHPGEDIPSSGTLYLDHVDRLTPAGQQYFAHRLRTWQQRGWEHGPRVVASAGPAFVTGREPGREAGREPGREPGAGGDPRCEFDPALLEELRRFPLELSPLRERREDVREIADQIVGRLGERMKREVRLAPDAHAFLERQGWPGNVQQLARLLERGVGFCASGWLDAATIEQLVDDFEESLAAIRRKREIAERDELLATLARTGGNISRTAEEMGRSRGAVYRLIEKYGIALPKAVRKRRSPSVAEVEAAG